MNPRLLLCFALVSWLSGWICQAGPKPKPAVNQEQRDEGFCRLFETIFSRWDRNGDGKLDLKEINTVIEDPQVHGNESAIAAVLHRRLQADGVEATNVLTLAQALALARDPGVQQLVSRNAWHIQAINHSLFLQGDPSLATFHQGHMGDCYLLAVVGALVYHRPQTVRGMIQAGADRGFEVRFANGRQVSVEPMTDAELIMGAIEGRDHGFWLSVLEKAYARISKETKEAKTGQEIEAGDAVVSDLIGHGGTWGPVIVLLSGHTTARAPVGRWLKEDPHGAIEKAHELLTQLTSEHRLIATGTTSDKNKALPPHIAHHHVFAVLNYNPSTRMVRMFNPWGNQVKPAGSPGLANGYPTAHGIFEVPLSDFLQIFGGFTYETDKPVKPL